MFAENKFVTGTRVIPADATHIHLVGVGGIGVSALAPILLHRGYTVSGSDPARNEVTERLRRLGVRIHHQHRAENIEGASLIVVSSAIARDNPERLAAERMGVPVWRRAEMLGCFLEPLRGIVVTGAHGKTTVTAMITLALVEGGIDPTALVGGDVEFLGGNARVGAGEWIVAEGDESDGSFLCLRPEIAVVNNIDRDHLDFYPGLEEITLAFQRFLQGVREGGWILLSADCDAARRLTMPERASRLTYGFHPSASLQARNYHADEEGISFDVFEMVQGKEFNADSPHDAIFAIQMDHPNDNQERLNLGGEYGFKKTLFLRLGGKIGYDEESISGGFGLNFQVMGSYWLQFDYAYSHMGRITEATSDFAGQPHRFSLGFLW